MEGRLGQGRKGEDDFALDTRRSTAKKGGGGGGGGGGGVGGGGGGGGCGERTARS